MENREACEFKCYSNSQRRTNNLLELVKTSRVDSVKIAVKKVRTLEKNGKKYSFSVVASDAFFPFKDGIKELVGIGIKAIIQPGGSKRDDGSDR